MTPSKENCLEALAKLDAVKRDPGIWVDNVWLSNLQWVADFLASAAKRLPRETALAKDKQRKRPGKVKPK